jgi:hypothetical protein
MCSKTSRRKRREFSKKEKKAMKNNKLGLEKRNKRRYSLDLNT